MDKIGVNQKKSTYSGAVITFDFGVNMGEPRRFGAFSEDTMVEMTKKKNVTKADQKTEFAVNVLQTFCAETSHIFPAESQFSISSLNQMLARFCIAVRNKKGELYVLNTMTSVRFSLQRYFVEKFKCDIISDEPFHEANLFSQTY